MYTLEKFLYNFDNKKGQKQTKLKRKQILLGPNKKGPNTCLGLSSVYISSQEKEDLPRLRFLELVDFLSDVTAVLPGWGTVSLSETLTTCLLFSLSISFSHKCCCLGIFDFLSSNDFDFRSKKFWNSKNSMLVFFLWFDIPNLSPR